MTVSSFLPPAFSLFLCLPLKAGGLQRSCVHPAPGAPAHSPGFSVPSLSGSFLPCLQLTASSLFDVVHQRPHRHLHFPQPRQFMMGLPPKAFLFCVRCPPMCDSQTGSRGPPPPLRSSSLITTLLLPPPGCPSHYRVVL